MGFAGAVTATMVGALLAADGGAPPAARSLLAPPPPVAEPVEAETFPLRRAKDGSGDLVYESSGFTARVAKDGTVAFKDKRVSDFSWFPFTPRSAGPDVPSLASTVVAALRGRQPPAPRAVDKSGPPPESTIPIPYVSRYRPDPREGCRECEQLRLDALLNLTPYAVTLAGNYDITDDLARLSGKDPYRVAKARFLAATRDVRMALAAKAHAEHLRRARQDLPARLAAIAADDRYTCRERRALLEAVLKEMDPATPEGREVTARIEAVMSSIVDYCVRR